MALFTHCWAFFLDTEPLHELPESLSQLCLPVLVLGSLHGPADSTAEFPPLRPLLLLSLTYPTSLTESRLFHPVPST